MLAHIFSLTPFPARRRIAANLSIGVALLVLAGGSARAQIVISSSKTGFTGTNGANGAAGSSGLDGDPGQNGFSGGDAYIIMNGQTAIVMGPGVTLTGGRGGNGGNGGDGDPSAASLGGSGGDGGPGGNGITALSGSIVNLYGGQFVGGNGGSMGVGGVNQDGTGTAPSGFHGSPGLGLFANGGKIILYGTNFAFTTVNGRKAITGTLQNNSAPSTIYYGTAQNGQIAFAPEPSQSTALGLGIFGLTCLLLRARRRTASV